MFLDNSQLAAAVRARLLEALGPHRSEDEAHLVVDVCEGCAILHGRVQTWTQHEALERAALTTPGITRVENLLGLFVNARLRVLRGGDSW